MHRILEALGEFRSGQLLLEFDEAEAAVHALGEDAAETLLALDNATEWPFASSSRAAAIPAAPPPMTTASKDSSFIAPP